MYVVFFRACKKRIIAICCQEMDSTCEKRNFRFLLNRYDWILSKHRTHLDFCNIATRQGWYETVEQMAFILDRFTGDRMENLEKIVSTLNLFPGYICKLVQYCYRDRLSTTGSSSYNLQRGFLYKLDTLTISCEGSDIVLHPKISTIVIDMIRVLESLPEKLIDKLLHTLRYCSNGSDIDKFCVILYESLFLDVLYTRDIDFSSVSYRTPISVIISNTRIREIMRTRNDINFYHIRHMLFSKDIFRNMSGITQSRKCDFHFVYSIPEYPSETQFKGHIVFLARKFTRDQNFVCEARFYDFLNDISQQRHVLPDHIFKTVPKTSKLLQERFVSDHRELQNTYIPSYVKTKSLTDEQNSTIAFIRNCENTNFRDTLSFMMECEDGENVVMCCPYLGNATIHIPKTTWDACAEFSGGIIANQTGSGKTLCVIMACSSGSSLVVVPDHLVSHWRTEITKHTDLKINCSDVVDYVFVFGKAKDIPMKFDCLRQPLMTIISFSAFRSKRWSALPIRKEFDRVFIEEAHTLDSSRSIFKALKSDIITKFTWAVTATPYKNFQNILMLIRFDKFLSLVNSSSNILQKSIPIWQLFSISTKTELEFVKINTAVVYAHLTVDEELFFTQLKELLRNIHKTNNSPRGVHRVFRILERISAGGRVDARLMLQVVERCLCMKRKRTDLCIYEPVETKTKGYMKSTDTCVICVERFSDPLQLVCGHVFCKVCILAMIDLGISNCAICRMKWKLPLRTFLPSWFECTSEQSSLNAYYKMLEGEELVKEDSIELKGKCHVFKQQLLNFIGKKQPEEKLVIYVKREMPAQAYLKELRSVNLSLITVGVEGMSKSVSIANIEKFREGKHDVLFISVKYSSGIDIPMASHLWIMDYDLNLAKMEQCKGRCVRLGQKHKEIHILVFLYRNTFDEFLYKHRNVGYVNSSLGNCILLEYFFFNNDHDSVFHRIKTVGHLIFGPEELIITAHNRNLRINHVLKVNIEHEIINDRYTIVDILKRPYNDSLFVKWRYDYCEYSHKV